MSDNKNFSKKIRPACAYCENGREINGGEKIFCLKKGLMSPTDSCHKYDYNPLKRCPKVQDFGRDYKADDFKL